jgi:hypothetical protein
MATMLPSGDSLADLLRGAKQTAINSAAASVEPAALAAKAGKRFVIVHLYLEPAAATNLTFKSDTTELSGPISVAANEVVEFKNGGVPVFVGHDLNKKFSITNSAATQLNGFVVYAFIDTK